MNDFIMASEAPASSPKIRYQLAETINADKPGTKIHLAHRTDCEIAVKTTLLVGSREKAHALAHAMDADLQHILTFEHPNLVRHLAHCSSLEDNPRDLPHYITIMEYCSGGNLHAAAEFHIPAPLIQKWTRQIVDGLVYLHAQHIVHRDLTGTNILLNSPDWDVCQMKIGQLEATKSLRSDGTVEKVAGDDRDRYAFLSPEMIRSGNSGRKTDIWSLGCVVLQMISGFPRFVKVVDGKQVDLKIDLAITYYIGSGGMPVIPPQLPDELRAFVAYCLKRDPVLRPQAAELLHTSFLTLANVPQWPDCRPQPT
ncbi:uncharacterized protein LOC129601031 [Paramacrobiotus metropolitanus]|uniref:uncharacterized protein LOC129601031 n=1 Tax=Paramacrobiotus metropolitanus TaxID=2943436 RepID=UPI0024463EC0|nr:uncharacterized protein LOC129601031 [Paramacrobiotus metropolitanus]